MSETEFDAALVASALELAAQKTWRRVSVAGAAQAAGLDLAMARRRFPCKAAILMRLGSLADQSALTGLVAGAPLRDTLFDMLMRRIDVFQHHRAGVLALFEALPTQPATVLLLADATRRSMRWMLDAAGESTGGLTGALRVKGLVAVWLWTICAWRTDDTEDMASTMTALDKALTQAERAAPWLRTASPSAPAAAQAAEDEAEKTVPTDIPPPPPDV